MYNKNKLALAAMMMMIGAGKSIFDYNEDMYLGGKRIPRTRFCKCGNKVNRETSDICKDCAVKLINKKSI